MRYYIDSFFIDKCCSSVNIGVKRTSSSKIQDIGIYDKVDTDDDRQIYKSADREVYLYHDLDGYWIIGGMQRQLIFFEMQTNDTVFVLN